MLPSGFTSELLYSVQKYEFLIFYQFNKKNSNTFSVKKNTIFLLKLTVPL